MAHTVAVQRLLVGLVAVLLGSGCAAVDGTATGGDRAADPAFFFSDAIPTYGHQVNDDETVTLAHLRALRRVDVCGLVDQAALAKIGELSSVASLYAFEECDYAVKLPGQVERRFLAVTLDLAHTDQPESFRAGAVPVFPDAAGSCEYLVPVALSALPGAAALTGREQPFLRVGMLGDQDCGITERLATAVAQNLASKPLPARDGAARYPVPLAERDPCEVLAVLGEHASDWNVAQSRSYTCDFSVRDGLGNPVALRMGLRPKIVEIVNEGTQRRVGPDGQEIRLDPDFCSATVFVGPAMQRRLADGEFVDVANVVVRPAITVDGGDGDCSVAVEVAGAAAKLFR